MFDRSKSIFFKEAPDAQPTLAATLPSAAAPMHLKWQWPVGSRQDYGVLLQLAVNGREDELKYSCRVTRREDTAMGEPVFAMERIGNLYINETKPDLVAEQLAYAVGQVFFPLAVCLNEEGGFQRLVNHEEILARWPAVKERVRASFEGVFSENYLARMDVLLQAEDAIFSAFLANDWFLHLFFPAIYRNYATAQEPTVRYFPLLPSFVHGYTTQEVAPPAFNHFGAIALQQHGELRVEASNYSQAARGDYNGLYILHPAQKHIIAFQGDWTYEEAGLQKKTSCKFFLLEEDTSEVTAPTFATQHPTVSFVDMADVSVEIDKSRGGFWGRWFTK